MILNNSFICIDKELDPFGFWRFFVFVIPQTQQTNNNNMIDVDDITASQPSDLEEQEIKHPAYLDEMVRFTAPPAKKKKREIKLHPILKSDVSSEDIDLHNMENSSKITFPCVFIERFSINEKGTSVVKGYNYVLQCLSEIDVEIPMRYSDKNDKAVMNSIKSAVANVVFKNEKDVDTLVLKPGEIFRTTDFNPTESDYGFFFGRVVLFSDVHLRIGYEIKNDENIGLPYHERVMTGDPVAEIKGVVKMQMDRKLDDFYHIIKASSSFEKTFAKFKNYKIPEIPASCRLEGVYDAFVDRVTKGTGAVSTMVIPGQAPKPAGAYGSYDNVKTPYNFTEIPTSILYKRKKPVMGFWFHLDNTMAHMVESGREVLCEDDDELPIVSFSAPKRAREGSTDLMKESNYHWTLQDLSKKARMTTEGNSIVGILTPFNPNDAVEYTLSAKSLYDINCMFGFTHPLTWSSTGPMIARGWSGLGFFLIDDIEDTAVPASPVRKFCISGKTMTYLDPLRTFSSIGLEVSKSFVDTYFTAFKDVKNKDLKPDPLVHNNLNPYNRQYTSSDFKYKPSFLNLKELNMDARVNEKLNDGTWRFFMVPPENILYDELGDPIVANMQSSAQVLKALQFKEQNETLTDKEREDAIASNWFSNALIRPLVSVFAVDCDFKSNLCYSLPPPTTTV